MYIDIRSVDDYNNGHIEDAININYIQLLLYPQKYLKKDNLYFIYCNSGIKSKAIVSKLNKIGYNCVNVEGGYNYYLLNQYKI